MPTVLVVDDDPEWIAYLTEVIGDRHPVLHARSGQEGLKKAQQAQPDLILLDVMMAGGMDGFTTFVELRRVPETRSIPVIMFSEVNAITNTEFSSETMKQYLGSAPIAFLEKPATPEALLNEIENALNAGGMGRP